MMEKLRLEGKWWVPDQKNKKFEGILTFDHQLKTHVLTITSGIAFETGEMGNRAKPRHDIILGETYDGQKITLKDCERGGWSRNVIEDVGSYSFTPKYVLLGDHFERPENVIFDSIHLTYSGKEINRWINSVHLRAFVKSNDSVKVKIRDNYNISILGKPKVAIPCIKIESLKEQKKSLEDYLKVNLTVLDFLNFVVTEEVHGESQKVSIFERRFRPPVSVLRCFVSIPVL
ncbi:MAG: hypothetical protein M3247_04620 [Thermoproteota archaeon]|nr:hypothetical protein [Thermoproteota archaeon]